MNKAEHFILYKNGSQDTLFISKLSFPVIPYLCTAKNRDITGIIKSVNII